jgi:hypothetical protein
LRISLPRQPRARPRDPRRKVNIEAHGPPTVAALVCPGPCWDSGRLA